MGLFADTPKPTVKSIEEATKGALSVFRTALASLQSANDEAATLFDENEGKIQSLLDTNDALMLIKEDNEQVITNIGLLLSPKKDNDEETNSKSI